MSNIEWTEATWNPVSGCTKISEGCKNCYAEKMANRLKAMGTKGYENGFEVTTHLEKLYEPHNRKKPTMYFVCSMADIFHGAIPYEFIDTVFQVMSFCPQHTFQVLTKRPERMQDFLEKYPYRLPNVWLGVTVESPKHKERIDILRDTPAALRFLSIEPLLEDLGELDLKGIDWVIVGGETGAGARPLKYEWVKSIQEQCEAAKVPLFFKKWGKLAQSDKSLIDGYIDGVECRAMPEVAK